MKHINTVELMKSYWFLMIFPAVIAGTIQKRRLLEPKEIAKEIISYRLAALPFIRDIANPILSGFDYSLTPVESGFEVPSDLYRAFSAKEDRGRKILKHSIRGAGYAVGLPASQLTITLDGILDMAEGKTDNPARLLFREEYKKNKVQRRR